VYEIAAYLLIPYAGPLEVGGRRYETTEDLRRDYENGVVTPQALKEAVAVALIDLLSKLR
jgi:Tyrosyl-tRNA synthetase